MKLTAEITDLDNKPINEGDGADAKTVTLGGLLLRCLLLPLRGDDSLTGDQKVKVAMLAHKIHGKEDADLTAEEVTLLKDRSGKAFTPLIVMRIWALIDPASVKV